jgi:hypothetical protein
VRPSPSTARIRSIVVVVVAVAVADAVLAEVDGGRVEVDVRAVPDVAVGGSPGREEEGS